MKMLEIGLLRILGDLLGEKKDSLDFHQETHAQSATMPVIQMHDDIK